MMLNRRKGSHSIEEEEMRLHRILSAPPSSIHIHHFPWLVSNYVLFNSMIIELLHLPAAMEPLLAGLIRLLPSAGFLHKVNALRRAAVHTSPCKQSKDLSFALSTLLRPWLVLQVLFAALCFSTLFCNSLFIDALVH